MKCFILLYYYNYYFSHHDYLLLLLLLLLLVLTFFVFLYHLFIIHFRFLSVTSFLSSSLFFLLLSIFYSSGYSALSFPLERPSMVTYLVCSFLSYIYCFCGSLSLAAFRILLHFALFLLLFCWACDSFNFWISSSDRACSLLFFWLFLPLLFILLLCSSSRML